MIFVIVAAFVVCVGARSYLLKQESVKLAKRQEALESQIEMEEERTKQLEDQEKYMHTKKYVEDVAKTKLGLVYPDEILIQPQE